MHLKKKRCRCCGRSRFRRLESEAEVDPFFAHYGLQVICRHEAILPQMDWGLQRKIQRLPSFARTRAQQLASRLRKKLLITSQTVRIPYGLCQHCMFLAPWYRISDDQLRDYYAFYLTPDYKQARIEYQPGYASIADIMGSTEENRIRRKGHELYLMPVLDDYMLRNNLSTISLLDYGGNEGGLQPVSSRIRSDVYEINANEEDTFARVDSVYDCVQCLHVLEHVGDPRHTCLEALKHCKPGGLFYVEVPIEFPGLDAIEKGNLPPCHEHLNKFCLKAIEQLLLSLDGEILRLHEDRVDFLHLEGLTPVIRGLFRKKAE